MAAYCVFTGASLQLDPLGELCISISIGYMVWDTMNMGWYDLKPFAPIATHHCLSAGGMSYMLTNSPDGTWAVCVLLMSELSTPILNAKAWLEFEGQQNTFNYRAIRWGLLGTWLVARLAVCAYFGYWTYTTWNDMSMTLIVLALMICPFLSIFNMVGMVTIVLPGFPWTVQAPAHKEL